MKKKRPSFKSLIFNKNTITQFNNLQGGKASPPTDSDQSDCCTNIQICPRTVTTRPDSISDT